MKNRNEERRIERIAITVTEVVTVSQMWRTALQLAKGPSVELVAVLLSDDRWQRAATLPFTREISRLSGAHADFTLQRASEVHKDTIETVRKELQQLASEASLETAVEVMPESDRDKIRGRLAGSDSTLVVPALLANHPLLKELEALGCRITLVDS